MQNRATKFGVRVVLVMGGRLELRTVERWFETEAALRRWIERESDLGRLAEIAAYCDDQG